MINTLAFAAGREKGVRNAPCVAVCFEKVAAFGMSLQMQLCD